MANACGLPLFTRTSQSRGTFRPGRGGGGRPGAERRRTPFALVQLKADQGVQLFLMSVVRVQVQPSGSWLRRVEEPRSKLSSTFPMAKSDRIGAPSASITARTAGRHGRCAIAWQARSGAQADLMPVRRDVAANVSGPSAGGPDIRQPPLTGSAIQRREVRDSPRYGPSSADYAAASNGDASSYARSARPRALKPHLNKAGCVQRPRRWSRPTFPRSLHRCRKFREQPGSSSPCQR